jgi:hypothetical protein
MSKLEWLQRNGTRDGQQYEVFHGGLTKGSYPTPQDQFQTREIAKTLLHQTRRCERNVNQRFARVRLCPIVHQLRYNCSICLLSDIYFELAPLHTSGRSTEMRYLSDHTSGFGSDETICSEYEVWSPPSPSNTVISMHSYEHRGRLVSDPWSANHHEVPWQSHGESLILPQSIYGASLGLPKILRKHLFFDVCRELSRNKTSRDVTQLTRK